MYFPYLRGKQFELIALREICGFIKNKTIISPVIEPVKESTVSLVKSIECLVKSDINFNLIVNPKVGDLITAKDRDSIFSIVDDLLNDYDNFQPSVIITNKTKIRAVSDVIKEKGYKNISLICNSVPENEDALTQLISENDIKYVFANNDAFSTRSIRNIRKVCRNLIKLSDQFNVLTRNADYSEIDNEFFSEEHLFFKDENYFGFSDFLTVGKDYSETGFLPHAIAIHFTYINKNNEIWIRHFVSDRNEGTSDVAGKFSEALEKLVRFINSNKIKTNAAHEFVKLHAIGSYPGLGSIKKLSISHHIELVYNYLNNFAK